MTLETSKPTRGANAVGFGCVSCWLASDAPENIHRPEIIKIIRRCRVSAAHAGLIAELAKIGGQVSP
jgi:hypothetical protein